MTESMRESAPLKSASAEVPLEPASAEVIAEIERRLEDALGANGLDECVCAVCGRLELRKLCQVVEPNDWTCFKNMKRVLQVPVSLPEALAEQYSYENLRIVRWVTVIQERRHAQVLWSEAINLRRVSRRVDR